MAPQIEIQWAWKPGNWSTSTNPTGKLLIQVPVDSKTEMCGDAVMHDMQFSVNDSDMFAKISGMLFCKKAL
jgi:hypothetical protein